MPTKVAWLLLFLGCLGARLATAQPPEMDRDCFAITVVDQQTGRGVPLVELRTVNGLPFYTDSGGVVAFDEPALMGQRVFFHVASHGYEFPQDGFGYRGKSLDVVRGGQARLEVKRLNIAERLYRMTGEGIYRDTVLSGGKPPTTRPLLNAQVLGSDSVINAVYQGKIYWFWGDTNRPSYPLGNFHVPGATSRLPSDGGLDPNVGVNLEYFLDEQGFAKETARLPGDGPTWLSGLLNVADDTGTQRLLATYVKIRNFLEVYERGLVEFDDASQTFKKISQFDLADPLFPDGHPFRHTEGGVDYFYFATPYPVTRVPATAEAVRDLSQYEAYTCLEPGSTAEDPVFDRDENGTLRWRWKRGVRPLSATEYAKLSRSGRISETETLYTLRDVRTDEPVVAHRGSVYFNPYRQRWVMIATQQGGTSFLGEVWYAEADAPLGPWVYARKIVTHDKYSFYNPKQHPMFDERDGREIFFEGTYTDFFSGAAFPTPRYDYNQIMYKLDLADPRLVLPVAVYRAENGRLFTATAQVSEQAGTGDVAFFAPDRSGDCLVPVFQDATAGGGTRLLLRAAASDGGNANDEPAFYALPTTADTPPKGTAPLLEFANSDGSAFIYSTDPSLSTPGYARTEQPLGLVWRNPLQRHVLQMSAGGQSNHAHEANRR